ncbi:DUF1223 domain-containing protein [Massilia sp. DWR3-1-1]|uniref:DUF1223 domain-containing protein n=1 Tax=Massilia sp. DWR3-1-1 TaxID=2804559 RepID=UPI003CF9F34E
MRTSLAVGMLACMAAAQLAYAQSCSGHSPAHTVALLELYTSEGCSSCPPADRALSGLRAAGLRAEQVAPLSLHVDYWDRIGWRDRFSRPDFTQRQRMLAAAANTTLVYTPAFFVNGRELRNWSGALADTIGRTNARPARADIGIAVERADAATYQVVVKGKGPPGSSLQVAVHQNNLDSIVTRGENGGRTLHHDYVARHWFRAAPLDAAGTVKLSQSFSLPDRRPAADFGITAFISAKDGSVLQAYSLPLCGTL